MNILQSFFEPFQRSRKLRAAAIALLTILVTALLNRERIDPDTLINAIVLLASAYMGAVAWEDTANARAQGDVDAAHAAATVAATTTTVSTPGTSDVSVTPAEPTASVKSIGLV